MSWPRSYCLRLKNGMIYSDLFMHPIDREPFNHGTTSINYQETTPRVILNMFPILEAGWGVQSVQQFQQMTSLNGEFGGNKYFRFQMYDKWYFFKQNHSDTKRQQVSDDTELHSREYGVPTRKVLPTVDGKTHFKDKRTGFTYSVYEYIDGEHFDGSRIELLEAASNIATLHRALAALPISQQVDDTKEPFFHHNRELLLELLEKFNRPVFQPLIGKLSLTIEEIKEISLEVSRQ